jgi:peptidyl-prolyl cis-trans isomerase B (cyclophilin B)
MPSKSRQRHLAKGAERRRLERERAARRRTIALSVGGAIAGILIIALGVTLLNRNDASTTAGTSLTPSASATTTPTPNKPPKQTGTVTAQAKPANTVACGASVPADASTPKPQFDHAPSPGDVLDKNTEYTAILHTSCGDVTIALDPTAAPQTVASFVFLAEQKFFDGTFFHRVVDSIDVVQGGDPTGTGSGGPGYQLPDEPPANGYQAGSVAMANAGTGTTGSQFFLVVSDTGAQNLGTAAPFKYSALGTMDAAGLKVAKKINTFGGADEKPTKKVYVYSVDITESDASTTTTAPATTAAP